MHATGIAAARGTDYTKKLDKGVKGLEIAYSPTLGYVDLNPEIAAAVDKAVSRRSPTSGPRSSASIPASKIPAPTIFRTLWWSGARLLLNKLPKAKRSLLDPGLNDVVEQSKAMTIDDYLEAQRLRGLLGSQMRHSWRSTIS